MDRNKILQIINDYSLDKSRIIVISGAALVLLNVVEAARDIDIYCDREYYEYLLKNYNCEFERTNEFGEKAYMIDGIINFGLSYKPNKIMVVEGLQCASLKDILDMKKFLNRAKDKAIIKKLELIVK